MQPVQLGSYPRHLGGANNIIDEGHIIYYICIQSYKQTPHDDEMYASAVTVDHAQYYHKNSMT